MWLCGGMEMVQMFIGLCKVALTAIAWSSVSEFGVEVCHS